MANAPTELTIGEIECRIRFCHGRPTLLATDLAEFYGVSTAALLKSVHRHGPLPGELSFCADALEAGTVPGDRRCGCPPEVFTEYGALAAAYLIGSDTAIAHSIQILRAFTRMRCLGPRRPGQGWASADVQDWAGSGKQKA